MTLARLQHLLSRAGAVRVACVGDLMLDRYIYGDVARVSPEAPIPVLMHRSEAAMLGAVGNVARNVAALGAEATLAGLVGADPAADDVARLMAEEGRIESHLVVARGRPTIVKSRFVASGQQLLRLDYEQDGDLDEEAQRQIISAARSAITSCGAVILSDYAKGAVGEPLIAAVLSAAKAAGAPVIVDPKGRSFAKYGEAALIKPNAKELALVTDLPVGTNEQVETALAAALAGCAAHAILVTRAGAGMSLAVRGRPVAHFPGRAQAVFDVSGAGDTSIAALGVALAAGAEIEEAVSFAVLASGVVVGKVGTATVSPAELLDAEARRTRPTAAPKIVDRTAAAEQVARWKSDGYSVGFTNGCFDILHVGHVTYLEQAGAWCDRLVLGLNSDDSVRRLKGEGRPVNDVQSRARVLAGLSCIDLVIAFDEDTPLELIKALRPDVLVKGADYAKADVVGAKEVEGWGGVVRLAEVVDGYSTTSTIARLSGSGPKGSQ